MLNNQHCCAGLCKIDPDVSREESKCQKLHEDLTKPQWESDIHNLQELEIENFSAAVAASRSE